MIKNYSKDEVVLVGVLKDKRDLNILLTRNRYRIPVAYAPRRRFDWLAFYQPASFGRQGKCIRYYASVLDYKIIRRNDLLPDETDHPKAFDYYYQIHVGEIKKLPRPIRNIIPRRISFGFTTLNRLLESKNILQLYGIPPTEQIIENVLRRAGIKAVAQYYVSEKRNRYRVDFAVFCRQGAIAIECDNKKAHSGLGQRKKDEIKNNFLKRYGWTVIRLPEDDIVFDLATCIIKVQKAIQKLGGMSHVS